MSIFVFHSRLKSIPKTDALIPFMLETRLFSPLLSIFLITISKQKFSWFQWIITESLFAFSVFLNDKKKKKMNLLRGDLASTAFSILTFTSNCVVEIELRIDFWGVPGFSLHPLLSTFASLLFLVSFSVIHCKFLNLNI